MEGFLLIDKPAGITSHDVVDAVRRVTHERTVGHAGTLDPFATGLLIVAVGRGATKQLSRFVGLDKEYEATIRLDGTSTTGDTEGVITPFSGSLGFGMTTEAGITTRAEMTTKAGTTAKTEVMTKDDVILNAVKDQDNLILRDAQNDERIREVLRSFLGPQLQTPPMYSAKKIGGKKLYELARAGQTIERKPVPITIHELELINYAWPELKIRTRVSSGTYVRTLGEDIGRKLGMGGYLTALRRTKIGNLNIEDATTLSKLESDWVHYLLPTKSLT